MNNNLNVYSHNIPTLHVITILKNWKRRLVVGVGNFVPMGKFEQ